MMNEVFYKDYDLLMDLVLLPVQQQLLLVELVLTFWWFGVVTFITVMNKDLMLPKERENLL
jgi:hypothetical protein